jgi:hypothetical protein
MPNTGKPKVVVIGGANEQLSVADVIPAADAIAGARVLLAQFGAQASLPQLREVEAFLQQRDF